MLERSAIIVLLALLLISYWPKNEEVNEPLNRVTGVVEKYTRPVNPKELRCMIQNIYFEARNQSIEGMWAVAEVVRNRMHLEDKTACQVIHEFKQFSWYKPGMKIVMNDK